MDRYGNPLVSIPEELLLLKLPFRLETARPFPLLHVPHRKPASVVD